MDANAEFAEGRLTIHSYLGECTMLRVDATRLVGMVLDRKDAIKIKARFNNLQPLLDACKGLLYLPDAHTAEELGAVGKAARDAIADVERDLGESS